MHQTGQSFRFLLNVENVFLYSSKSFPLKNLVDIYFPKIIPRRARRIFEMDIFSTHESSRGPRNSNNEFRNERFRSFPNFHQSMNVIPAADLSTRPNSFPSLRVYAYPTYESPREQCSRRFGRLLGRERNRGGIDRGLKADADTLRGGPPLSPRLGRGQRRSMERAMKVAFARLRAPFHSGLLFMGIRGWFLSFGGPLDRMTIMICGSGRV